MKIDYETLSKIKNNIYTKLKDGIYDGYLVGVRYDETNHHHIPSINFVFEIGTKKINKAIHLTDKNGKLLKFNKQRLDRWLAIINGQYPEYSRRNGLKEIVDRMKFDKIPVRLTLITPIGTMWQNFSIEFE